MRYFFDNADKIKKAASGKNFFLFFDYDGTLAPVAKRPELAKLSPGIKKILGKISKKYRTAVISGRPLAEIKKTVGLKGVVYSGNHGFETDFSGERFVHPAAEKLKPEIRRLKKIIQKRIKNIPGSFVEDKGLTASVHWRLVGGRHLRELFAVIGSCVRGNALVRLTKGKKVWEIRPAVNWDKGLAVKKILTMVSSPSTLPVYAGDDVTDEDAFKALKNGITVRVGKSKKSKAGYYLKNQSEMAKFLNFFLYA